MRLLRSAAKKLLGDYSIYRVLELNRFDYAPAKPRYPCRRIEGVAALQNSSCAEIQALQIYAGEQAIGFVAEENGASIAACWYWYGDTYKRRNFWPLKENEAKLVQITTAADQRGRGVAEDLIRFSSGEMFTLGFKTLYARVWHSHRSSLAAFRKAGWREIAWVVEIEPAGHKWRFCRRLRR